MVDESEVPIPKQTEIGGYDETVNFNDKAVAFKFKRLSERNPGESWISLVYGPSKTGKTYFAGTAGPRTLFLNIGDGLDTLLSPGFTSRYPESKQMIVVDIRETNARNSAEAFDHVTDAVNHALKHFHNAFDNIVMDEATALRKYALNKAMELNTDARKSGVKRENRLEEYVKADIGDYGEEMSMIEWFLGQYIPIFKREGKHFLMLAHERQIFAKPSKIGDDPVLTRIVPGFTGKTFPDKVPAFFDDVMHTEVIADAAGNKFYRLRTAGDAVKLDGVRHNGIFKDVEPDPNFLKMLNRIQLAQPKPK